MNKKYEGCLFHSNECGIFSKTNVDGLFVVSDSEKCLNFAKGVVAEKELIALEVTLNL